MRGVHTLDLDQLDDALRLAPACTAGLFHKVVQSAGTRFASLRQSGGMVQIDRLIESYAWTDAALLLIELAIPHWKVRRIVHTDGEWLCSLSRCPNLPIDLDDAADASHEVLSLAMLRALVVARCKSSAAATVVSAVPQIVAKAEQTICCDNFA
jgi:hypothetical protein